MDEEEVVAGVPMVDIPEIPPTDEEIAKKLELIKLSEAAKAPSRKRPT